MWEWLGIMASSGLLGDSSEAVREVEEVEGVRGDWLGCLTSGTEDEGR